MSDPQTEKTESKASKHIPTFINSVLTAAVLYCCSTLDAVRTTVIRLETQNQNITEQIKTSQTKIDTAYYTSQQHQADIAELKKNQQK